MAKKRPSEVRRFYLVAQQRFEEAQFLLEQSSYTTAAVYLGGYAAECALKAVILRNEPPSRHATVLSTFKGVKAHDFDWLRNRLERQHVPTAVIGRPLSRLNSWTTDLRYSPVRVKAREAEEFLNAVWGIVDWMKGKV